MSGAADDPYPHLAGRRFPPGEITLGPHVAWLWADCVTATPDRASAEPSTAWMLAMRGHGVELPDLFALVDATADDGVVLGEVELELHRPLEVGARYAASAEIVDVVRKRRRGSGVLDVLRLRIDLREVGADVPTSTVVNSIVFPREEPA